MKRAFEELSDDEWENHSFQLSRVLKNQSQVKGHPHEHVMNGKSLPSIESFAFQKKKTECVPLSLVEVQSSEEDDDFELGRQRVNRNRNKSVSMAPPYPQNLKDDNFKFCQSRKNVHKSSEDDDDDFEIGKSRVNRNKKKPVPKSPQKPQSLEDDDFEVGGSKMIVNRSRRLVVVDDSDDDTGIGGSDVAHLGAVEVGAVSDDSEGADEDDVVGNALQKCDKISATLRKELYGSASVPSTSCEGYSEVEDSAAKIVTQADISAACADEDSDFEPVLKPYQLVGVNFLLLLYRKKIGGAILADEMGLGKTIQAITYLTLLKHLDNDPGPHLIVCPASVLENWERELQRWCPSFSVIQYHGAARAAYAKELNFLSKSGHPPPFNVLLVCYSLFERHSVQQKDDRRLLKRWKWSCVLMDEAHVLKDRGSYRRKNLFSVAKNANQRLMLTGTPLQNDLHELWSLLEFMMPEIFETGDVDLKKLLNAEDKEMIARIKSILAPFVLRRLKSDVMQQLVPKIQRVEYVTMVPEQDTAYRESINEYRAACEARAVKNSASAEQNSTSFLPQRQISNYFTQFRKIANHPLLVRRIFSDSDAVRLARMLHPRGAFGFECTLERVISELKTYNDFALHKLLVSYGGSDAVGALEKKHVLGSAKCQALAELLPSLKKAGHRVLIFSQWTTMLDILEWALDVIGVTYSRLDGSTQVAERQTIVDTFNNDTSIFACLLSTRAGGQGLNLTGADTVIIHDMDFNPQMDRQAEDRCHRIGQTKPVTVYRLVTKGTVDENIFEIAKRKLILDAAVLESGVELAAENEMPEKTMAEILSSILLG
ncbi:protein CHROMATIN REMODELING 19 isoform X1 [Nymphaea colorata]|nr:protein CHROMATIN REMODELING 19 isoform X1 [Nymphaea colorata]XP_031475345.1 protein CHROMATIN REMODELING 19 isoform X1 [Nymphaea colorata]XP_031475346.1 protein CHROMATIN REMODELING 19 isoform X1 [Nymphaea colorata]XP_031475347.1 protein CHROMATIN REMODELING 19 isoform X1 [Nymphaea colorata]